MAAHAHGGGSGSPTRDLFLRARTWASGRAVDLAACRTLVRRAVEDNHVRHRTLVPAYRRLTDELGLPDESDYARLRAGAVVTDEWFKGYDDAWLHEDPDALVAWLAEVSTVRPRRPVAADWDEWRDRLRADDVFVTFSSGTSGTRSIVPRDRATLAALRSGSGSRFGWGLPAGEHDLVLLTEPGRRTGLQAGATGLAAAAARVHHSGEEGTVAFLAAAASAARPVLLYGSPGALACLLAVVGDRGGMPLPPGSALVTGGGWKDEEPEGGIPALQERAGSLLGLPAARCCDTYSAAHLNTVFVSCPRGRYHVPPVVEALVVDDRLEPVEEPRARGRLAVADPFAASYPGIVATGDEVELRADPCQCGLAGQTLAGPVRRLAGGVPRGCGTRTVEVRG